MRSWGMPGAFEEHQWSELGWSRASRGKQWEESQVSGQELRDIMRALQVFVGDGTLLLISLLRTFYYVNQCIVYKGS